MLIKRWQTRDSLFTMIWTMYTVRRTHNSICRSLFFLLIVILLRHSLEIYWLNTHGTERLVLGVTWQVVDGLHKYSTRLLFYLIDLQSTNIFLVLLVLIIILDTLFPFFFIPLNTISVRTHRNKNTMVLYNTISPPIQVLGFGFQVFRGEQRLVVFRSLDALQSQLKGDQTLLCARTH